MLQDLLQIVITLTLRQASLATVVFITLFYIYSDYTDPLKPIPGPWIARWSRLWLAYHTYIGDESRTTRELHIKYGPIVRIGPNDVDIADGEALSPIYADNGGFEKTGNYENFDVDGYATIFAARTVSYRMAALKPVLPIFSLASARDAVPIIRKSADKFVLHLEQRIASGGAIDILDISRSFGLDAITASIFRREFGALDNMAEHTPISSCLNAFVSYSRIFYLPTLMVHWLEIIKATLTPDNVKQQGYTLMNTHLEKMVNEAVDKDGSFQSRLLGRGFTIEETIAQCKDNFYAGTESVGSNLATILWYLARQPEVYAKLREESTSNPEADVTTLPYLNGVIKEGLRLSMSISTRLPRCVPAGGWVYKSPSIKMWSSIEDASQVPSAAYLPAGTSVGVPAYSLHLNPSTFPDPESFTPERWFVATKEMYRDWIPFGKGTRSCTARNLVMTELAVVVNKVVLADILKDVRAAKDTIERQDWFMAGIKENCIELVAF